MNDKKLAEVSNRTWDAFVDQLPKEFTGRNLMMIMIRFVVNIANAVDMKPTTVCMIMLDDLRAEQRGATKSIENALLLAGIVAMIVGTVCKLWFNYQLGVKIFDVGCMYILAYWALEFAGKVIDRWS